MTGKADVLARFAGEVEGDPLFLPDLTLWYEWRHSWGTLPERWQGLSLPQVARALGAPVWSVARLWRVETPGVGVTVTEREGERVVRSETSAGTLVARWTLGPDEDWWQTEYPVKTAGDLPAAVELAEARSYVVDAGELPRLAADVGDDGVLALELPRRPYSDLLHEFLGWSEGLTLLREPAVREILAVLETKLQGLVEEAAPLQGDAALSPDNLDGQFISPRAFEEHLADSYRRTAEVFHARGRPIVVHVGGPIRRILAGLAESGVDVVEGVAGPPQGDVSLAEAREIAGPGLTLWGGIPQDLLLDQHDRGAFEAAVAQAAREAAGDRRTILGVADRVPVDADPGRLEAIPALVGKNRGEP